MNRLVALFCLSMISGSVLAYLEPTHDTLADIAVNASALGRAPDFLKSMGIPSLDTEFPGPFPGNRSVRALIRRGVVEEDRGVRFFNHFFDVQHGGDALWICDPACHASPKWILDGTGQDEEFSYRSAVEAFVKALTGPFPEERDSAWALLFETLGHVIHHVQDMAQPEHVRDDAHPDLLNQGYYELHTDSAAGRASWRQHLDEQTIPAVDLPKARDYWANPDRTGIADFTSRNFLSKATNFLVRGGSAVANPDFPDPSVPHPLVVQPEETLGALGFPEASALCTALKNDPAVATRLDPAVDCTMQFIAVPVDVDGTYGTATELNQRAASLSVFDQYLRGFEKSYSITMREGNRFVQVDRLFTLNRFNFNSGYRFLVPRAVSYSAGLINHFFRGRMELAEPAEVVNGTITLKIRNASSAGNDFSSEANAPAFWAYYESLDGTRKRLPIIPSAYLPGPLPAGHVHTLHASVPEDAQLLPGLTIVFDGTIGHERGIAGLVVDVSEPGLVAAPAGSPAQLLTKRNGDWYTSPESGFLAGRVDWKGRYVDGKPTRVLTWSGHSSRYFREKDSFPFLSRSIYEGGKIHSTAPDNVLGAAITTDEAGKEWIVAVVYSGTADHVYRRPNVNSDSNALYHPQTAPEGWQLLGSYPRQPDEENADQSWFFNGDGTEAQTVRRHKAKPFPSLRRLKLVVSSTSSAFQTVENGTITIKTEKICNDGSGVSRTAWSGHVVFAVDYVGNQERLGKLVTDQRGEAVITSYYNEETTLSGGWKLELPGITVDLQVTTGSGRLSGPPASTIPFHWHLDSLREFRTNVPLFADLRSDVVALAGSISESSLRATNDPLGSTSTTTNFNTALFAHNGVTEVAYPGSPRTQAVSSTDDPRIVPTACSGSESWTTTGTILPPLYVPAPDLSFATGGTDRDGNVFASMHFKDEDGQRRAYSFLTNGDPIALFGVGPDTWFHFVAPN